MLCATWPHIEGDLASSRRGAEVFLDNLDGIDGPTVRRNWVARWTNIGDAHCLVGDLSIKRGGFDEATKAWLRALTAFEVARRLVDQGDPQSEEASAKIAARIQRVASLEQKVELVEIESCDDTRFLAHYLPASSRDLCAPAVICITREEEAGPTLLGRLLPAVVDRGMSVLVVSHDDVASHWRGQSEMFLACCLDYLSERPEVDATRIGVYGEGLSAALATNLAVSDRRIAAAVCDGGLWNLARTVASVGWMTRITDAMDEDVASAHRLRLLRRLRCPVLVVVGGRSTVSVSEAIKLKADCTAASIDLELAVAPMTRSPVGEIENFVTSDDCIFGWLEHKLAQTQHC